MPNQFVARKGLIALDDSQITGSLDVSGSISLQGSGSTLFEVNGSEGQLFSITDSLSGSLFAVSDVSGLPILEVFSDDTVKIGSFNNEAITVNGSTAVVTGSFTGSFVGDGSNLTGIETDPFPYTGSAVISGSLEVTGSVSASTYYGDGSNLTGISSDPFPYTGDAIITGSNSLAGSYALKVANSSGTDLITAENDGTVELNDKVFINGTNISPSSGYALNVSESVNIRGTINFDNSSHQAWIKTANLTNRSIKIPGTGGHGYFEFYNTNGNGIQLFNSSLASNSSLTLRTPSTTGNNPLMQVSVGTSIGNPQSGGGSFIYYDISSNPRTYTFGNPGSEGVAGLDGTNVKLTASPNGGGGGARKGGNVYIISTPGSNGGIDGKVYITGSTEITGSLNVTGDITGSNISASTYYGDGSNLTGISSDPFPYTGSAVISGSLEVTGSVSASTYYGDGSNLTGISSDPFPYTGSAVISGSLDVKGGITITGSNTLSSQYSLAVGNPSSNNLLLLTNAGKLSLGRDPYLYMPNGSISAYGIFYSGTGGSTTQPAFYIGSNQAGAGRGFYGINSGIGVSVNNAASYGFYGSNSPSIDQPSSLGIGVVTTGALLDIKYANTAVGAQGRNLMRISGSADADHAEVFLISNSGNTGIGTWSPNYKLEVVGAVSASTYYGDGSNLTGIETDPFPYTGSAVISGSLEVTGSVSASTYYGDGSNLTGISSDPFPYTGDVEITGSNSLAGNYALKVTNTSGADILNVENDGKTSLLTPTLNGTTIFSTGDTTLKITDGQSGNQRGPIFETFGDTGGWNGSYDFKTGYNGGATTTSAFKIIGRGSNGANTAVGIGNFGINILETNSPAQLVVEKHTMTTSNRNEAIRLLNNQSYGDSDSDSTYYGIQFNGFDEGTRGGSYIGTQTNDNGGGYSADFVVLATGNAQSSYSEIARFVGWNKSFYIGEDRDVINSSYKLQVDGAVSASTYYGDGSNLTGISSDPFPYTGSAIISGSLTLTGSFNALLPTSSTDTYFVTYNTASYELEARQVATLINPKVEYLDVTASISSGTSITLPNGLSYISSSTYEYLEVFFNGLRLRYDRDFVPTSTTTIQNQIAFPSGSELTFKSLKA